MLSFKTLFNPRWGEKVPRSSRQRFGGRVGSNGSQNTYHHSPPIISKPHFLRQNMPYIVTASVIFHPSPPLSSYKNSLLPSFLFLPSTTHIFENLRQPQRSRPVTASKLSYALSTSSSQLHSAIMAVQLTPREQELIVLGFKCAESAPKVRYPHFFAT